MDPQAMTKFLVEIALCAKGIWYAGGCAVRTSPG
jgi:hypothetical protein